MHRIFYSNTDKHSNVPNVVASREALSRPPMLLYCASTSASLRLAFAMAKVTHKS